MGGEGGGGEVGAGGGAGVGPTGAAAERLGYCSNIRDKLYAVQQERKVGWEGGELRCHDIWFVWLFFHFYTF